MYVVVRVAMAGEDECIGAHGWHRTSSGVAPRRRRAGGRAAGAVTWRGCRCSCCPSEDDAEEGLARSLKDNSDLIIVANVSAFGGINFAPTFMSHRFEYKQADFRAAKSKNIDSVCCEGFENVGVRNNSTISTDLHVHYCSVENHDVDRQDGGASPPQIGQSPPAPRPAFATAACPTRPPPPMSVGKYVRVRSDSKWRRLRLGPVAAGRRGHRHDVLELLGRQLHHLPVPTGHAGERGERMRRWLTPRRRFGGKRVR